MPCLRAATTTLDAMAAGGIYDHVGGGFSRYSVDDRWLVPHFEKMLYDQALLVRSYLHAWQLTGAARHRQVLDETITYVLRDLRHPGGGFYSAEDADSEGEEGLFYLWTPDQVRAALGPDEAPAAMEWWGVTEGGNFEGRTILNRLHARGAIERPPLIQDCRLRLFDARGERVRPGLDDKVLTEWNGLMLASLAEAAAATGNRAWLEAAVANGEFLCSRLRSPEGRWLRSWQGTAGDPDDPGRARHHAFAADHAALVDGFTRLAEATGEARWIAVARATADVLLALFRDTEGSGFFTTGADAEALVARPKDLQDGATPSANSNAAWALLRLAALTGEDSYRVAAEEVLALLGPLVADHSTAFAHLAAALDLHSAGTTEVVVPGAAPDLVGRGPPTLAAGRGAGLGRALPLPAVGGAPGGPRLRVPLLRLPGPGDRPGRPGRHPRRRLRLTLTLTAGRPAAQHLTPDASRPGRRSDRTDGGGSPGGGVHRSGPDPQGVRSGPQRSPSLELHEGQAPQPWASSTRSATAIWALRLFSLGRPLPPMARQVDRENWSPP